MAQLFALSLKFEDTGGMIGRSKLMASVVVGSAIGGLV
jgi:hypothetical protein